MTFLWVASRISNAGTICPAAIASILSWPPVSLSTRSAKYLKLSCKVRLAGQVDCILRTLGAGCCAPTVPARPRTAASARKSLQAVRIGCLLYRLRIFEDRRCGPDVRVSMWPCQRIPRPGAEAHRPDAGLSEIAPCGLRKSDRARVSKPVVPTGRTPPVYGFRAELPCEPPAGRAQRCSQRAPDPRAQSRTRRRLEQDDLAWLLGMDEREAGALERQRVIRGEETVVPVPVLRDPQRPAHAFESRP